MNSPSIRIVLCLAGLFPARVAVADTLENANGDVKVDVVVNLTEAGKKIPRPTPDHPAYYYPITRGYTQGGAILTGEKLPPPTEEVQHLIAKALADQGYLVATRHPPSLVLIIWWGYKAPELMADNGLPSPTLNLDSMSGGVASGPSGTIPGFNFLATPPSLSANHSEMEELVFGSEYEPNPVQDHPSLRLEALVNASRVSRYYLMVSALDFKAAMQKKAVILWTARISTALFSHTLDQVLPTLISSGAPMFGRDSDGPQITSAPIVPLGHVIVGTPVLKTDPPASAAPSPKP